MEPGTKVSVTLELKNNEGETISKMDNRKGKIQSSANEDNSAYFIMFDGRTEVEAVSTKYITEL